MADYIHTHPYCHPIASGTISAVGLLPALSPPRAGSMDAGLFDEAMKHYHLRCVVVPSMHD